jgi:hypothetical protein
MDGCTGQGNGSDDTPGRFHQGYYFRDGGACQQMNHNVILPEHQGGQNLIFLLGQDGQKYHIAIVQHCLVGIAHMNHTIVG